MLKSLVKKSKMHFGLKKNSRGFLVAFLIFSIVSLHAGVIFAAAPTVTTLPATNITKTNAQLLGFVSDDGGQPVSVSGFEFGLTPSYGTTVASTEQYIYDSEFDSSGTLSSPKGIATDTSDNIYVVDSDNDRIQKFDSNGNHLTNIGTSGTTPNTGELSGPSGIAFDSSGNFFVTQPNSGGAGKVDKFDSSGNYIADSEIFGVFGVTGVGVDKSNDNLYIALSQSNYIQAYDNTGTYIFQVGSGVSSTTIDGSFSLVQGVTVDSAGDIYAVDNTSRIQKFHYSLGVGASFVTKYGSAGSGDGQIAGGISSIFIDPNDNIFIGDMGNHRIQKFDSSGTFVQDFDAGDSGTDFAIATYITMTSDGDVYVSDTSNNRVVKFKPGFTADLSAVIPSLTCGTTYHFRAYATNSDGTSYGSDQTFTTLDCDTPVVKTVSSSGVTISGATLYGSHEGTGAVTTTSRGFEYGPTLSYGSTVNESGNSFVGEVGSGDFIILYGIGADSSGNVYTTDQFDDKIQKFGPDGTHLFDFSQSGSSPGDISFASSVRVSPGGSVFVADTGNSRVEKFNSDGSFDSVFASGLNSPIDVAFDSSGNVYILNQGDNSLEKYDSAGTPLLEIGASDGLSSPTSLALDSLGNIYVADNGNSRIQKFDSTGAHTTNFGSSGSGDGEFAGMAFIAIDDSDNLYVVDSGNTRVQKFDSSGTFSSSLGSSGTGNGEFSGPAGITFGGPDGDIFISDSGNNRIQKFNEKFNLPVSSLTCGTTYNFRAFATNADGTAYGSNDTFTTSACATSSSSSGGGGGTQYICVDPKALNYTPPGRFGRPSQDICVYPKEEKPKDELSCGDNLFLTKPVKYGANNNPEDVKLLEKYLNTYEGANLTVDGVYGKKAFSAVVKWQEKYKDDILKPWGLNKGTGYVYITSLRKIKEIQDNGCAQNPSAYNISYVCYLYQDPLKKGNSGVFVKGAQKALNALGFSVGTPDGIFGDKTLTAVKSFQKAHGININGLIGPTTGAELSKAVCKI